MPDHRNNRGSLWALDALALDGERTLLVPWIFALWVWIVSGLVRYYARTSEPRASILDCGARPGVGLRISSDSGLAGQAALKTRPISSTCPRTLKAMPASSASVVRPMVGVATMITPAADPEDPRIRDQPVLALIQRAGRSATPVMITRTTGDHSVSTPRRTDQHTQTSQDREERLRKTY